MKHGCGTWTGISIDLWRQLAAELKLSFEFRELHLRGLLGRGRGRLFGCHHRRADSNNGARKNFAFSHPYYVIGLGIVLVHRNP